MDKPGPLSFDLPPDALLSNLLAFGRDWRDSKITSELKAAGIGWCRIEPAGQAIRILIIPLRTPAAFMAIGTIAPLPWGSGSTLTLDIRETWFSRFGGALFTFLPLGAWLELTSNSPPSAPWQWALILTASAAIFALYRLALPYGRARFAQHVALVARHALAVKSPSVAT